MANKNTHTYSTQFTHTNNTQYTHKSVASVRVCVCVSSIQFAYFVVPSDTLVTLPMYDRSGTFSLFCLFGKFSVTCSPPVFIFFPLPTAANWYACAGLSVEGTLYNPNHFAAQLPDNAPCVFYIGAMASGHLTKDENPEV